MAKKEKQKQSILDKQKRRTIIPIITAVVLAASLGYLVYTCLNTLKFNRISLAEEQRKERAISKMQDLKIKETELLKIFPKMSKKNDIIEEIAGWARKEGLEVNQIEPKESAVTGTNFRQLMLTMSGKGSYIPITHFLKRVESSSYFVLASGFQLGGYELKGRPVTRYQGRTLAAPEEVPVKEFKVTVHVFLLQS